jgi:hypothetical protein
MPPEEERKRRLDASFQTGAAFTRSARQGDAMAVGDRWDRELRQLTRAAEGGEVAAALELLRRFANFVRTTRRSRLSQDAAPPPRLISYLARCAQRILDGEDPSKALNLKRAKTAGRPPDNDPQDAKRIYAVLAHMSSGKSETDAVAQAAIDTNADTSTIRRALRRRDLRDRMLVRLWFDQKRKQRL